MPFGRRGNRNEVVDTSHVDKRATLGRLTRFVLRNYKFSCLTVMVCIIITSVATLSSTLFTRTLIDDYIVPLTRMDDPEYRSLAQALFKLGAVLMLGVIASYTYNRIMISVSQGTMLRLRKDLFSHMERLPISYFDTHSHGEIMSTYTNDVGTIRMTFPYEVGQMEILGNDFDVYPAWDQIMVPQSYYLYIEG